MLDTTKLKLGRLITNPTVASKCSRERESHTSVTSNQKLGMIWLSGDSILTVQIDRKLGLLCKQPSYGYRGRVLKEIKDAFPVNSAMMRKWDRLLADG